jgi:hypothetical protein
MKTIIVEPFTVTWSNKNRGLFLPIVEGHNTISTIFFKRNDRPADFQYTKEYDIVLQSLQILKDTPFEEKRFQLCPSGSFTIFLNGFTVRITNTGTNLVMILTEGRFGSFNHITK